MRRIFHTAQKNKPDYLSLKPATDPMLPVDRQILLSEIPTESLSALDGTPMSADDVLQALDEIAFFDSRREYCVDNLSQITMHLENALDTIAALVPGVALAMERYRAQAPAVVLEDDEE